MSFDFSSLNQKMKKTEDYIWGDIATLRTGRATVQILDPVVVEAYGSKMKIGEVATVTAPDATLLVLSPWDKSLLADIEKAIASSNLNLNPVVDSDIIRIAIAPLTEEKRKEMVKMLFKKVEAGKVMFRNLRTDSKKEIESQKGSEGVSEDDIKQDLDELESILKSRISSLDESAVNKEKELMTV